MTKKLKVEPYGVSNESNKADSCPLSDNYRPCFDHLSVLDAGLNQGQLLHLFLNHRFVSKLITLGLRGAPSTSHHWNAEDKEETGSYAYPIPSLPLRW